MKMINAVRVSQVLAKARDIVATRWNKNNYVTGPNGEDKSDRRSFLGIPDDDDDSWGYCGDGALRRAIKNEMKLWKEQPTGPKVESLLHDCQKALAKPIEKRNPLIIGRSHHKMWIFNDLKTTTKDDILAIYDEAIEEQCEKVRHDTHSQGMDRQDG